MAGGGWKLWQGYGRPNKYWRPPQPPGSRNSDVPQWEKRFCVIVNGVPWWKIREIKLFMPGYTNVVDWDDSAALEAFQNAKSRYWAQINHLTSDISLPDPDVYNDEVDHDAVIDAELVEDLENIRPLSSAEDETSDYTWDPLIYANQPVIATGWDDYEDKITPIEFIEWDDGEDKIAPITATGWSDAEDGNATERHSVAFLDKETIPVEATGWGVDVTERRSMAFLVNETTHIKATGWDDAEDGNIADGRSVHTSINATGWGDAKVGQPLNANSGNEWNNNTSWPDGTVGDYHWGGARNYNSWNRRDNSWNNGRRNPCNNRRNNSWNNERDKSWNNVRANFWNNGRYQSSGVSYNWNTQQGRRNGKKRNEGNHGSGFVKSGPQMNNYQTNSDNRRERNTANYERTMHAGQPMRGLQWRVKNSAAQ